MQILLVVCSCFINAVVGALVTVTGHRGEKVDIKCPYESGYETNSKYVCKGECKPIFGSKVIMVESGSPAKDERFSLTDDKTNRVFTVTITDLRTEDEGQYWCVVKRRYLPDIYSEVLLLVKGDPPEAPLAQMSSPDTDSLVIIITSTGVVLVLLIGVVFITVAVRKKKQNSGLVSGLDLTSQTAEENAYERGNPSISPNSHTSPQTDGNSAVNGITVDSNTEIYTNTAVTNGLNLDQIYTELNSSRTYDVYQTLTQTRG